MNCNTEIQYLLTKIGKLFLLFLKCHKIPPIETDSSIIFFPSGKVCFPDTTLFIFLHFFAPFSQADDATKCILTSIGLWL